MKITGGFLLIFLGALVTSCAAEGDVATTVETIEGYPSSNAPIPLKDLDLKFFLDNLGELPDGLRFDGIPREYHDRDAFGSGINEIEMFLRRDDEIKGSIAIVLHDEETSAQSLYLSEVNNHDSVSDWYLRGTRSTIALLPDPKIGEASFAKYWEVKELGIISFRTVTIIFRQCHAVVIIFMSLRSDGLDDEVFEFSRELDNRLTPLVCR